MVQITTRPMQPGDIEHCAAIIANTPLWQRYGVTLDGATTRLSAGLRANAPLLVADDGTGTPVGFVWVVERGAFDLSSYIRWIAVTADRRSGGVGHQLLVAAEGYARQLSRDIFLLCSDFNVDAQRFYERYGYTKVGAIPDYVIPGVVEFLYRKRFDPTT